MVTAVGNTNSPRFSPKLESETGILEDYLLLSFTSHIEVRSVTLSFFPGLPDWVLRYRVYFLPSLLLVLFPAFLVLNENLSIFSCRYSALSNGRFVFLSFFIKPPSPRFGELCSHFFSFFQEFLHSVVFSPSFEPGAIIVWSRDKTLLSGPVPPVLFFSVFALFF